MNKNCFKIPCSIFNGLNYPIIISVSLTSLKEEKLLRELRTHSKTIRYIIENLKRISPSIYMHKIPMEERLNPNIKEVVKKEILKLLDAGIIYPIFYSKWISLMYIVPEKNGIVIIKNENKELIPTRTVNS